jgi:hypothetical protein
MALEQHPPEVRGLTLAEQVHPGLDPDLAAAIDQLGELLVAQAAEDAQGAELVDAYQIVAR